MCSLKPPDFQRYQFGAMTDIFSESLMPGPAGEYNGANKNTYDLINSFLAPLHIFKVPH